MISRIWSFLSRLLIFNFPEIKRERGREREQKSWALKKKQNKLIFSGKKRWSWSWSWWWQVAEDTPASAPASAVAEFKLYLIIIVFNFAVKKISSNEVSKVEAIEIELDVSASLSIQWISFEIWTRMICNSSFCEKKSEQPIKIAPVFSYSLGESKWD